MLRKIDHLVITTENLPACLDFYRALGFQARDAGGRWELFAGDFKINVHIRGRELEPKALCVQPGSADLCFEVDVPLESARESLKANGIIPETDILLRHGVNGEMRSLYLRDPDGNLIELCSYN